MLFRFNFKKECDLTLFKKSISYYIPMMKTLNVDLVKYSFTFDKCTMALHINRRLDAYDVLLYDSNGDSSQIRKAFETIFETTSGLANYQDVNLMIDKVNLLLKLVFRFDKLKAFI